MERDTLEALGKAIRLAVFSALEEMPDWSKIRNDILSEIRENHFHERKYRKLYKKLLREIKVDEEQPKRLVKKRRKRDFSYFHRSDIRYGIHEEDTYNA